MMDEILTILTTGGLIALFALFGVFFLFAPGSGYKKHSLYPLAGQFKLSLYRMTGLMYLMCLLQTLVYAGAMLFYPHLILNWKLNLVFEMPILPFLTFVIREMLYPDKSVDGMTIFRHTVLPMSLLVAFLVAYNLSSETSEWFFWLMVAWAVVYVGVLLPRAAVRIHRYNVLAEKIFVDAEGHSLTWMAYLSGVLLVSLLGFGVFSIIELTFLTTWVYNLFAFVFFVFWGSQISRMHYNNLIHIDEPESEAEEDVLAEAEPATEESEAERMIAQLEAWLKEDNRLSSQDLNREMVARAMGTNHIALARILRQQRNMTLVQFVTDVRLREAERLLLNTNLSIEEIYGYVGYQSRSTFYRAFQERNNCTASKWREQRKR